MPIERRGPGLQDLVAGGVEIVPCSLPEARSLIDAGKVQQPRHHGCRAPPHSIPDVPTLKDATGSDWTHRRHGAASSAPKGLPKDVADKLLCRRWRRCYKSAEFKDFMEQRGFGVDLGAVGASSPPSWRSRDKDLGAVMKAVGIAK